MGKILIGHNSALIGFSMLFVLIISLITAVTAAISAFVYSAFLGVVALITLIVWISMVVFSYRNFDKLKKGFSHETE